MTPSGPTAAGTAGGARPPASGASSDQPLTVLRGNGVDIDPRRAGQWVLGACGAALLVVAIILLIAGIDKNAQADTLSSHGVPVKVTVISCLGLLGGSGSNGAGYACKGTYMFQGRHFAQDIPGNVLRAPGSTVRGVIAPGDPGLLSTPSEVAGQHSSWTVFVAPAVLFAAFVLTVVALIRMVRRGHQWSDVTEPP